MDLITSSHKNISRDSLHFAATTFYYKLKAADGYVPAAKYHGNVMLLRAKTSSNYEQNLGADYKLSEVRYTSVLTHICTQVCVQIAFSFYFVNPIFSSPKFIYQRLSSKMSKNSRGKLILENLVLYTFCIVTFWQVKNWIIIIYSITTRAVLNVCRHI